MEENLLEGPIGMPRGSVLRIDGGAGILLRVREGELWLTQDGSSRDHILCAGQCFRLEAGGATLAQAFRRTVVSLSPERALLARRIVLMPPRASEPVVLHRRRLLPSLHAVFDHIAAPLRTAA